LTVSGSLEKKKFFLTKQLAFRFTSILFILYSSWLRSPDLRITFILGWIRSNNAPVELSLAEMDALQALYRDGVKLAEQEQAILKDEPNSVIPNLGILTALRAASESDTTRAAPVSSASFKSRNPKRKVDDTPTNSATETPIQPSNPLSTSVATPGGHTRLKATTGRSTSVPSVAPKEAKEVPALKIEEPASTSAVESVGTPSKITGIEKSGASLKVGTEVAFRNNKHRGLDGEFIQCTIISVVGDGVKKRYN
jgi:SAGA-associated factor 29